MERVGRFRLWYGMGRKQYLGQFTDLIDIPIEIKRICHCLLSPNRTCRIPIGSFNPYMLRYVDFTLRRDVFPQSEGKRLAAGDFLVSRPPTCEIAPKRGLTVNFQLVRFVHRSPFPLWFMHYAKLLEAFRGIPVPPRYVSLIKQVDLFYQPSQSKVLALVGYGALRTTRPTSFGPVVGT